MVQRRVAAPDVQRFQQELDVDLRDDEMRAHARQAAKLDEEITDEKERQAAAAKASRALVDELQSRRSAHLRKVRTGREQRTVTCERIFDFSENTVTEVRLDTSEQIGQRAMTYDERQRTLFSIPDGANTDEIERQREDFERFQREASSLANTDEGTPSHDGSADSAGESPGD